MRMVVIMRMIRIFIDNDQNGEEVPITIIFIHILICTELVVVEVEVNLFFFPHMFSTWYHVIQWHSLPLRLGICV